MEYFSKLNKKLDDGFKLTDVSCPTCKKTALFNPLDSTFQCISCETTLDFEVQSSSLTLPATSPPLPTLPATSPPLPTSSSSPPPLLSNPPPSSSSISRSNELSSKLAQKLLKGYTMLEECCPDCLVPLMRLKKEPAVCVGCDYQWLASTSSHSHHPPSSSIPPPGAIKYDQKTEKNLDKPRALPPPPPSPPVNLVCPPQPSSAFPCSPSLNLIRDNLMEMTSLLSCLYLEETKDIVKGKDLRGADSLIKGALPQLIGLFNQLNNHQK